MRETKNGRLPEKERKVKLTKKQSKERKVKCGR